MARQDASGAREETRESPFYKALELFQAPPAQEGEEVRMIDRSLQVGVINLRGDPNEKAFVDGSRKALPLSLPLAANSCLQQGETEAWWVGPNEWLLLVAAGREQALIEAFEKECAGLHFAVTEITGGYGCFDLEGPGAIDFLARGVPLDLDPRSFAPGQCAQTLMGQIGIALRPLEGGGLRLLVRSSFAEALFEWMLATARYVRFNAVSA